MNWYIPSWNGDFRFEQGGEKHDDSARSTLTVEKPTPMEKEALKRWAKIANKKKWSAAPLADAALFGEAPIPLAAPVSVTAAAMAKIVSYKKAGTLHVFKFENGKVEATESLDLPRWARKLANASDVAAAATVARPSLSCPECSGKNEHERKACDVLWEFLAPDQRAEWLKERAIHVIGGLTHHLYRVSSRDTKAAKIVGRCTVDETDRLVLHHYDWTVPPEEEVLSIKMMLKHRENWLRVSGEVDPHYRAERGTIFSNPLAGRALFGI